VKEVDDMAAIFECQECGHQAIYEQEYGLTKCPKCDDIHVDVIYGVPTYVSYCGHKMDDDYVWSHCQHGEQNDTDCPECMDARNE
jgi:hypothetical protein